MEWLTSCQAAVFGESKIRPTIAELGDCGVLVVPLQAAVAADGGVGAGRVAVVASDGWPRVA